MKNTIKIIIASAILASSSFGASCSVTNGKITNTNDCFITPEEYKFTLHKLMLCSATPSVMSKSRYEHLGDGFQIDLSGCDPIVDIPNGQLITTSVGSSTPLQNVKINSVNKVYTHYAIVIKNEITTKAKAEFNTIRYGAGLSQGRYCWTKNMTILKSDVDNVVNGSLTWYNQNNRNNWSAECSSSFGTVGYLTEKIDRWGDGPGNGDVVDSDEAPRTNLRVVAVDDSYKVHVNSAGLSKVILFYPLTKNINLKDTKQLDVKVTVTDSVESDNVSPHYDNNSYLNGYNVILRAGAFNFDIVAR